MKRSDFENAVLDIDRSTEGDAYTCDFHMASGTVWRKATWSLATDGEHVDIIALDVGDSPPVYVSIDYIEAIHPNS